MAFMNDIEGYVTNLISDEVLNEKWDIFFFNRISMCDNQFQNARDTLGCKIVMDMDDSWILPSNHLNYYDYISHAPRIEKNLREVDMVTCTHERLADLIRPFNSNVHVFPNGIPYGEHQFTNTKIDSDLIRIFWCGGITHEGDMEILKNPIQRLLQYKNKIQMVIGGYDESNELSKLIWDKMVSYFTSAKKLPHEIIKGTTPDAYMSMYENADIMVVPLLKSDWSANKSNLKLLEASCKKIPVICSAVAPYTDDMHAPVLWVRNQSDWYKHLNLLINNKQARIDYGEKIHEWGKSKYNLFNINVARRQAYADLIEA
jgi:glycosyltransferase involved in cell wall biosynthesis